MIALITVKRKEQLEWCEKSLQVNLGRIEQLHHALNESEAECGREREYSASLRNKVKLLEKSQHDLIEAAKLHNIIENDPLKVVGGGYK